MITLDEAKEYLRVDTDAEDVTIQSLLNAASNYSSDPDVDPVINEMWTSGDDDTDDGFDAALDNIFGF